MKNTQAPQEKRKLSLREIKELMALGLSPALGVDDEEDKEFYGRNTDAERLRFREETGDTKGQL